MAGALTIDTLNQSSGVYASNNAFSGIAKAWVNFNGTGGSASINKAFNVSSVVRNSAGIYTVNFTQSFPDANYVAVFVAKTGNTSGAGTASNGMVQTSSSVQITGARDSNSTAVDTPLNNVVVFA